MRKQYPTTVKYLDETTMEWIDIDFLDIKKGMKFMMFAPVTGEQIRKEGTLECVFIAKEDTFYSKYEESHVVRVEEKMYDAIEEEGE